MLFRDRPLLPDVLDGDIYLERPDLERSVLKPLLDGRNVLLLGDAGSGKTTLMRRTEARLRDANRRTAWVNASLAKDAESLLGEVAAALSETDIPPPGAPQGGGSDPGLLTAARALSNHAPAVILVDGLLDPEIGFDMFGRLRDELWAAGHAWLVALRTRDSAALRTPPADAFWGSVVEIKPLDTTEAARLFRLGLDPEELARVEGDRGVAGGYPRMLIREAEARLEPGADRAAGDVIALTDAARALGRSEEMAMVALIDLGRPASMHDQELLDRLSWSRPYTQRIFSRLEESGLVRSIPERGGERAGRPRKLYEPSSRPR